MSFIVSELKHVGMMVCAFQESARGLIDSDVCVFPVMATLQLPANNLANLANLPPGTKLYLTTNSKNPSGKGKLLLIPQGAILRASSAGETCPVYVLCTCTHQPKHSSSMNDFLQR